MRVLVGYASAHGSTREIAEHLGERLRRHNFSAEVGDLGDVDDLSRYDACVLGSAIHGQRWLPSATAFLAEHGRELAAKPVWLFSVGMLAALRWPLSMLSGMQADTIGAELTERVTARDHHVFSGVLRDGQLPLFGRLAMRLLTRGPGDYRDRAAIDQWADNVAHVLTVPPTPTHTTPSSSSPLRPRDGQRVTGAQRPRLGR